MCGAAAAERGRSLAESVYFGLEQQLKALRGNLAADLQSLRYQKRELAAAKAEEEVKGAEAAEAIKAAQRALDKLVAYRDSLQRTQVAVGQSMEKVNRMRELPGAGD